MNTIVGIILGVIGTILVSRYYFQRSVLKSITPYRILNTRIFSGIDAEVRKQLKFSFRGEDISELQQVEFLVANDGEQSISDLIEPLQLNLPKEVDVLDAIILHKFPKSLQCSIKQVANEDGSTSLSLDFPLLNKGDYFLVKLLLSGAVSNAELEFSILGNDLPRTLELKEIPYEALRENKLQIDWESVIAGVSLILIVIPMLFLLLYIYQVRPEVFPYPWSPFEVSIFSILVIIPNIISIIFLGLGGIGVTIGIGFEGLFSRGPHFPIPQELRWGGFYPDSLDVNDKIDDEDSSNGDIDDDDLPF